MEIWKKEVQMWQSLPIYVYRKEKSANVAKFAHFYVETERA